MYIYMYIYIYIYVYIDSWLSALANAYSVVGSPTSLASQDDVPSMYASLQDTESIGNGQQPSIGNQQAQELIVIQCAINRQWAM